MDDGQARFADCPLLPRPDLEITQLHSEKQREQARQDTLIQERKSLHQRLDAAEARQVQLENDFDRVKEDRDHQRLACTNLEQVYQSTKAQLQEKERGSRLLSHDSDRESQRLIRAAEESAEKAQARCRMLEEQLRGAQSVVQANERQRGNGSKRNGDATERAAALENEVTVLKAEVDRLQRRSSGLPTSPSGSSQGGRSRKPRASSVSEASSSEMQQLRVTIEEAEAKVGTLEVRAAKAEREALKASNERIALVKSSELAIAELKSTVADLKDEAAFQRHHVLKKLEAEVETLRADSSRASSLEVEPQASKTLFMQSEKRLCEKESHISTLQRGIDDLQSRLVEAREHNDVLVQQVCNAEGVAKLLARRDKEVASAKKRLRMLASSLRRTLLGVASSPAGEWEEGSQTTLGEADESTLQNTTVSRDFETDLLDEMDQLLGYVEEADGRVEFAKVEQSMQDRSALTERQALQAKIIASEEELRRLTEDNDRQRFEQDNLLASINALQTEKDRIEQDWRQSVDAGRTAASEQETLIAQIAALKENGRGEREQAAKKQQDMQSTIDSLTGQRDQQDDLLQASQARLEEAEREMIALQIRIAGLDEALQAAERTREGEEGQRQGLLSQIENLTEKDVNSEDKLAQASKSIQQLQRAVTAAELEAAKLALEATEDRMRLGSEARLSSEHLVVTLEQSQEALREEGEQWNALLKDLQRHLSESHAALSSSEVEREGEQHRHSQAIALLERELHDARAGMDKARELVKALELDLQEGRTNQQLAEDTLKRLVPSREGDVTVCADTPSGESLRETYDLRIQLQQAMEAVQEGKQQQESEQAALRAAIEDAERWRAETTVRDEQLAQAQTEQMQRSQALETLEARLQEAGAAQAEMTASIQRMEALLWERDTALQASQRAIEEHTKEKTALLLEAEQQRTQPSSGYAAETQLLESRLDASESQRSALQAQVDGLESTITQMLAEHCEHEAQRSDLQAALDALQASHSALRQTHAQMEAELVAAGEKIDKLNGEVEVLEEAARRETQKAERATVELEEARERYETLKKQFEDRNAEYWKTKEELAEWQERYEQSQVDVKIKNDLEERLKETEHALDEARGAQKEQEALYRNAQKQAEER